MECQRVLWPSICRRRTRDLPMARRPTTRRPTATAPIATAPIGVRTSCPRDGDRNDRWVRRPQLTASALSGIVLPHAPLVAFPAGRPDLRAVVCLRRRGCAGDSCLSRSWSACRPNVGDGACDGCEHGAPRLVAEPAQSPAFRMHLSRVLLRLCSSCAAAGRLRPRRGDAHLPRGAGPDADKRRPIAGRASPPLRDRPTSARGLSAPGVTARSRVRRTRRAGSLT